MIFFYLSKLIHVLKIMISFYSQYPKEVKELRKYLIAVFSQIDETKKYLKSKKA